MIRQLVSRLCSISELFDLIPVVQTIKILQSNYKITLDDVRCSSAEWENCSFTEDSDCTHSEDVFLSCYFEANGENRTSYNSMLTKRITFTTTVNFLAVPWLSA